MIKPFFFNIVFLLLLFQVGMAQKADSEKRKTIKIGLLVNDFTSEQAQRAAESAIRIANEKAGMNGTHFQLLTRSMEGAWGTGSKEAVNLVFEEEVWAILGSHDGRNAHLVEQVIAKTKVIFLSAWTSDPTLSQAFIPWFYNCVPNDIQQGEALVKGMAKNGKIKKIGVIAQSNYDAEKALKYLNAQIQQGGFQDSDNVSLTYCSDHTEACIKKIRNDAIDAVVLLGDGGSTLELFDILRKKGLQIPVFGTISMMGSSGLRPLESEPPLNLTVLNSGNWMKSNTLDSQNRGTDSDGISNAIAAYAFDGANVLINAITSSGFNRDKFNETMANTNDKGITGNIQFDKNGNRVGPMNLVEITNDDPIFKKQ